MEDETVQVGNRMLLWRHQYDFTDKSSFNSATVDSKEGTQIKVTYDTNEHQCLSLEDLDGKTTPYLVTRRTDAGKVESVMEGDLIYVYWNCHGTYWLVKVLGVAKEEQEENMGLPTKFRIQFYSGDLHVCDLSTMPFYPESHPLF